MKPPTQKLKKEKKVKKLRYWAGFVDNKLHNTLEYFGDRHEMPAIYTRKASALKCYEDVRLVEIKIINQ